MNLIQYKYVRVTNKNTFKIKHSAISPRLHHPPSLLADRKVAQPKGTGNKRNIQFGREKGWLWVQPEKKVMRTKRMVAPTNQPFSRPVKFKITYSYVPN